MSVEPIIKLMHEYSHRLDTADFEGFAELFRHGRWQVLRGDMSVHLRFPAAPAGAGPANTNGEGRPS